MKAEIISVGTEILLGEIVDTNSSYLASELPALRIHLYYVSAVGDNMARPTEVLRGGRGGWEKREGRSLQPRPAPPAELKRMWKKEALPRLKPLLGVGILLTRAL